MSAEERGVNRGATMSEAKDELISACHINIEVSRCYPSGYSITTWVVLDRRLHRSAGKSAWGGRSILAHIRSKGLARQLAHQAARLACSRISDGQIAHQITGSRLIGASESDAAWSRASLSEIRFAVKAQTRLSGEKHPAVARLQKILDGRLAPPSIASPPRRAKLSAALTRKESAMAAKRKTAAKSKAAKGTAKRKATTKGRAK